MNAPPTLREAHATFLRELHGLNRSPATIIAYATDVHQLLTWLEETNCVISTPVQVTRTDITEYLTHLAEKQLTGMTRARKLVAIRAYFRHLVDRDVLAKSPTARIRTPRKEHHERTVLTKDEYSRLLALAGSNVRDYAILQVFLQTGVRVSELCHLTLADLDLVQRVVHIAASKGPSRTIALEKKVTRALTNYLAVRPPSNVHQVFLNRNNAPFSRQGIAKLVKKYLKLAMITKPVSVHSLRHTFATYKAIHVSPYQLRDWLGHASIEATQVYVHLGKEHARRAMEATSL